MSRVLTLAPIPPEKLAYALARYSRSPDSIKDSIEWVRTHDSGKFLDSFYFQYGHASIADLGHLAVCFEGISELAATEIEDEPLWDGQARSSRYQNFSKSGFITPPDLGDEYRTAAEKLLIAYESIHSRMFEWYQEKLPKPAEMKSDAYKRNLAARAFDVARYCLFFGIPTGVGQVVSIRTLEKQVRRLKASEYEELRELGNEIAVACTQSPAVSWSENDEPIAPTLAKYVEAEEHPGQSRRDLRLWAEQNLTTQAGMAVEDVDLCRPTDTVVDTAATLLYEVTDRPYRELSETIARWGQERQLEVIDVALRSRTRRDELLRSFRGGPFVYDMVMDIGAYRDMHRHRRCTQIRQAYGTSLGYAVPQSIEEAGLTTQYQTAIEAAFQTVQSLPFPSRDYLLPFATKARFLFKMDFAEAEYICRLRSGVKGHFSYREIAWKMKCAMEKHEPALAKIMSATPPWVEDPLQR